MGASSAKPSRTSRTQAPAASNALHDGVFLDRARKAQRVTRAEVQAALRAQGKGEAAGITAVVLETDGTLTVIAAGHAGAGTLDFHRKGEPA